MPRVGELLREERERQGLVLSDIEKATSIRVRYLQAIEDSNYSALPGLVYAKGFVRNYVITLGLDEIEFGSLYKYELENPGSAKEESETPIVRAVPDEKSIREKAADALKNPPRVKDTAAPELEPLSLPSVDQIQSKKTVTAKKIKIFPLLTLVALFFCIVAIGVYAFLTFFNYDYFSNSNKPAVVTNIPQSQDSPQPSIYVAPEEEKPVLRLSYSANGLIDIISDKGSVDSIVVEVNSRGNCWTRVVADGTEIFSGTIIAGQSVSWQSKRELSVQLGDASVINMLANGLPVAPPNESRPVALRVIRILK